VIDVQEATISTATIEVKSSTINKKQVTLAVFRQLRQEPLLNGVSIEQLSHSEVSVRCSEDVPEQNHVCEHRELPATHC
jgi:hypothetical protein